MSDFWLNVIGLAAAGALTALAVTRLVKPILTGEFNFGGGIRFRKDERPEMYRISVALQLFGATVIVWLYGMLLYNKFIVDTDWMSR